MSAKERAGNLSDERYVVVSGDSHVGPSLEKQLRDFCPPQYIDQFDEFARTRKGDGALEARMTDFATPAALSAVERSRNCPGLQDPNAFLSDMDQDGIAAQVIFAGGGNDEPLPWTGGLIQAGGGSYPKELVEASIRIWNEWLSDFTSTSPERLLGVGAVPMGDIDAAVREVHWAKEHGLRALNLPAPRSELLPFNDLAYEPFWDAVEETGLPLMTHSASGEVPDVPPSSRGAYFIFGTEILWFSRRGLAQLTFGGVFDRHPSLKIVFTEQRVTWVGETLMDLDSAYLDPNRNIPDAPLRRPSEYWKANCYIAGSFMAPYEAARRDEVGVDNLMWGTDYPHVEGTWPRTKLALRNTFSEVPEPEARKILGDNAVRVFGLDGGELRKIADRIGPTPQEIATRLAPDEMPEHRGLAFRELGAFA